MTPTICISCERPIHSDGECSNGCPHSLKRDMTGTPPLCWCGSTHDWSRTKKAGRRGF